MKNPTTPDDALTGITRRLLADSRAYFGPREVLAIEPTEQINGRNSTILKSRVVFEQGHLKICIKVTKLKKSAPEYRRLWQDRVQTEYDVAALVYEGLKHRTDEYSCIRPIACFPDQLALVTEECPGQRLMSLLEKQARFFCSAATEDRLARYCYLSGQWLRILREETRRNGEKLALDELIEYVDTRLRRLVDSPVIPMDDELRRKILKYFESQETSFGEADLAICGVTGDFVPANVLAAGSKITVLDFSMYRHGSIYEDLAQYYQHLGFFRQKPIYRRRTIERFQREFLRGYDPDFDVANPLFKLFRVRAVINRLAATAVRKWDRLPLHVKLFNRASWRGQLKQLGNLGDW